MKFYKVVLKTFPDIYFAHSYETVSYNMHFQKSQNKVEISYVEKGDITIRCKNGEEEFRKTPFIGSLLYLNDVTISSDKPHKHYTFCITSDTEVTEISPEEVISLSNEIPQCRHTTIILTDCIYDKKFITTVEMLIKKIIYKNSINTYWEKLSALADIFEVFSVFTEYSFFETQKTQNSNLSPAAILYCNKAIKYIAKNIDKKIHINDISEELSISAGHLSRTFHEVTGYSIVEYVNHMKISLAKQLFETTNSSVSTTAQAVGIEDEKYFSKLFKTYTGMPPSEYRTMRLKEYKKNND